jgi:methylase of polypeptide subunit release factors
LVDLGRALARQQYQFITVTPETHRRVNERAACEGRARAETLRDVFGWNRPFERDALGAEMIEVMRAAAVLASEGPMFRSRVRFSSIGEHLFVHSSFPTRENDAVFFGPDTYRFCAFLRRHAENARRVVDIGCGSGAGGIVIADRCERVVLCDVNARALELARVNAVLAGVNPGIVMSDVLEGVDGNFDLIIANPPYMRDLAGRLYRDGGGEHGEALALRILRDGLSRLTPDGTLLLYTGAPVVAGRDTFIDLAAPMLHERGVFFSYEEIDPDVFGDELDSPLYAGVERIAAVGLCVRRRH